MIKNKRYDLNFIEGLLNLYDYTIGLRTYGIIVTPSSSNRFYQPDILCYTDDDKYEEGGNFYIKRFSMAFSGFGFCDKEKEDLIYNNIVKSKQLVDMLNKYVDKCNEIEISKEPTPEIPSLIKTVDYPYTGNRCKICGKPVHSTSATQVVCDKCASEYKF